MGEEIEFTADRTHSRFYRITAGAIKFQVRAAGNAAIGLSRRASTDYRGYWIGIGIDEYVWIKRPTFWDYNIQVHVPNVLSSNEYKKFWLTWYGDRVRLGRDGDTEPLVEMAKDASDFEYYNYIRFTMCNDRHNTVEYKFELPAETKVPRSLALTEGIPTWVKLEDKWPNDAVIGGYEKEILYIIRIHHEGSLLPGKFMRSINMGYIGWGGSSVPVNKESHDDIEILTGFNCTWVPSWECRIPVGAVPGGMASNTEQCNEELYIGRIEHQSHTIPGKVRPSSGACVVPFEGREYSKTSFDVLVDPNLNALSATLLYQCYLDVPNELPADEQPTVYLEERDLQEQENDFLAILFE